jgi:hypothetical protein
MFWLISGEGLWDFGCAIAADYRIGR